MTKQANSTSGTGREPQRARRLPAILAALVIAGHLPLIFMHFRMLWQHAQYHAFPIVLVSVAVLLTTRFKWLPVTPEKWSQSLAWLAGGLATLLVSTALMSPWLAMVAAILSTRGLLLGCTGDPRTRIWLLLWLLVPLPMGWDSELLFEMQKAATESGSILLDSMSLRHQVEGNIIAIPGQQFFQQTASGGAQSVFLLISLAAIYAVWRRRRLVHAMVLILSSIGWAFVANLLLVTATVTWNMKSSGPANWEAWQPDTLWLGLVGLAVLMIMSTDQLLASFVKSRSADGHEYLYYSKYYQDDSANQSESTADKPREKPSMARLPAAAKLVVIGFLILGLIQIPRLLGDDRLDVDQAEQAFLNLSNELLPAEFGSWTLATYGTFPRQNVAGTSVAHVWEYRASDSPHFTRCSFEIGCNDRQDVLRAYLGQGWSIEPDAGTLPQDDFPTVLASANEPHEPAPTEATGGFVDSTGPHITQYTLQKPTGERALLLLGMWDRQLRRLDELASHEERGGLWDDRDVPHSQLHVFSSSPAALSEEQKLAARELFLRARSGISKVIRDIQPQ